jgi:hypothetical protein
MITLGFGICHHFGGILRLFVHLLFGNIQNGILGSGKINK